MNREELQSYLGITGATLGQVEKDYMQHIILSGISRKYAGRIVFKGGTALQKAGILRRFSEDLDFTIRDKLDGAGLMRDVEHSLKPYNFPVTIDRITDDERTFSFRAVIEGPLFRNKRGVCTVRVECSRREELISSPLERTVSPPYSDIMPYIMSFMDAREAAAEKVRAVFTRSKARDLYDLHILSGMGIVPQVDDINNKLEYYGTVYSKQEFIERCHTFSGQWESELGQLVLDVPAFEDAMVSVSQMMPEV